MKKNFVALLLILIALLAIREWQDRTVATSPRQVQTDEDLNRGHSTKKYSYRVSEGFSLNEPFGLKAGDEIVSVNGVLFEKSSGIFEPFAVGRKAAEEGKPVTVVYERDGKQFSVTRTLNQHDLLKVERTPQIPYPEASATGRR